MPMHDWTKVDAGIYHHFHSAWIIEIHRALQRLLPADFYSLAEQHAGGYGPDVLTLTSVEVNNSRGTGLTTITRPRTKLFQETPADFYRRKQKSVVVHHVTGDRVVAIIEVVSPGNRNSKNGLRAFVKKSRHLLRRKIHLSIVDPFPPGPRDPQGLHAAIFAESQDAPLALPAETPLALIAYEWDDGVRAYLEPFAAGDTLPDLPVFLYPEMHIQVPLESTYLAAWDAVPQRWQRVIAE